jgi:hypothetical protein
MSLATGSRLRKAINRTKRFADTETGKKKTIFKQKGGPKSYKTDEQDPALLCLALLAALLCIVAVEATFAMQLVPALFAPFHARTHMGCFAKTETASVPFIYKQDANTTQHLFHSFRRNKKW